MLSIDGFYGASVGGGGGGGSLVGTFSVKNTSGSTMASGGYYTAYLGFVTGAVPSGNHIEIRRNDGVTVVSKFQQDLVAYHSDGSVRGVALNFKDTQSLAGGASLTFRAYSVAGAADNTSALATSGVTGSHDYKIEAVIGGVTYVTKVNDYIGNVTSTRVRASGPCCKEWDIRAPLRVGGWTGAVHAQMWSRFYVRLHEDGTIIRVMAQVINGYAADTASVAVTSLAFKDGATTLWIAGTYTHYRQAIQACVGLDGLPYWSASEPTFFTAYTPDDMGAARLLWRLDQSAGMISAIGAAGSSNYGIQTPGGLYADQNQTGGSGWIGMLPNWDAKAYITQDSDWAAFARTEAMGSLAAPVHWYNDTNFNLYVLDNETYSGMTGSTTIGWGYNPTLTLSGNAPGYATDASHYPNWCYYQFITTGDPWWLDEVQAHAVSLVGQINPDEASWTRNAVLNGNTYNGFLGTSEQTRTIAWAMRQLGDADWVTPNADVAKAYLTNLLALNVAAFEDLLIDQHDNNTNGSVGINQSALGYLALGSDELPSPWHNAYLVISYALQIARGTVSVSSRVVTDNLQRWTLGAAVNGCAYNALMPYRMGWWQGAGPFAAQPIATDWNEVYIGDDSFWEQLIPGGGCPGSGLSPVSVGPYTGGHSYPAIAHGMAFAAEDAGISTAATVRAYLDAEAGAATDAEWAESPQWRIRP